MTAVVPNVLVLLVLGTAPMMATDDELGLSRDGVTWESDLSDPLFDAAVRWVPGDARTASFQVRNQSPGLLPETGGPVLWWAIGGMTLVFAGTWAPRRRSAT